MILLTSRMLNSEGSCGIISMNYSTHGFKDTSHLKIVRLIMFMRNYGREQLDSWTSWVIGNSLMIRNIISNGLETQYLRLRT